MDGGKLTTPVTIWRNEAKPDEFGATPDEWVEVAKRRAQVISQRGSRAFNNGSIWYPTARVVKMRKPLDIDESCRLKIDGVMYHIINVDRLATDCVTISCEQVHEC